MPIQFRSNFVTGYKKRKKKDTINVHICKPKRTFFKGLNLGYYFVIGITPMYVYNVNELVYKCK